MNSANSTATAVDAVAVAVISAVHQKRFYSMKKYMQTKVCTIIKKDSKDC